MDVLYISILLLIVVTLTCFLAGMLTRNYSHVDRLWSVLPPVYGIIWLFEFHRLSYILPCLLVILWGIRLSYNFARRGGYRYLKGKGFIEEDYRWPVLKEKIPNRVLFELFNLAFISSFQLGLIFLFTLPLYFIGKANHAVQSTDWLLYLLFLIFLFGEFIADQQQYNYQSLKRTQNNAADSRIELGFNTFGLWKYSRHPNYFFELGQWVILWLLAVSATGEWHWTGLGAGVLIALFIGSTNFTETITASKYPKYKDWQKATPSVVPYSTALFRIKSWKKFWNEL